MLHNRFVMVAENWGNRKMYGNHIQTKIAQIFIQDSQHSAVYSAQKQGIGQGGIGYALYTL